MTFEQIFMRAQNEINRIKKKWVTMISIYKIPLAKEIHRSQMNQMLIQQHHQQEFGDFIETPLEFITCLMNSKR